MDIDEFIDLHGRAIYRFCFSLCANFGGNRELAEELSQEALVRLTAHYPLLSLQPESQRLAWLFTVARNVVTDHQRSTIREQKLRESVESDGELVSGYASDDSRLTDFLNELPAPVRELFEMRFVLGMNSREISQQLGIPEGTIRRRLQAGVRLLRKRELK